jgi:2-dehydropantoate 2-reductase
MARICVAGVGAVGAMLAARLHAAGHTVSLLARGERLAQLRRDGLRADLAGLCVVARLSAGEQPDFGIQDIVFVATKAQGLAALLPTLGPLIGPRTLVAPLVNGIPWWYFQGAGGPFDGEPVLAVDPTGALPRRHPGRMSRASHTPTPRRSPRSP